MTRAARFLALASASLLGLALAAPAASAQTPRKFTVHFGEGETALSKEGQGVVGAAAEMAQECGKLTVSLTGHDDGDRAQEVSHARADAVRKAMVDAGGINASSIKIDVRGAAQPVVAGAKDRQNRRVEISVSCS
jgi:outer membrane protein OmpA-like peptidoglycan-associated protein